MTGVHAPACISVVLVAAMLAGCSASTATVQARLEVTGDAQRVSNFAVAETARAPGLVVSIQTRPAKATFILPQRFTGADVVALTKRATEAHLSWTYSGVSTKRSWALKL